MKLKHVLASKKDKKPTVNNSDISGYFDIGLEDIIIFYKESINEPIIGIEYSCSRNGKTWYPKTKWSNCLNMPKIGNPIYLEVIDCKTIKKQSLF
jgi:hypothetical protein